MSKSILFDVYFHVLTERLQRLQQEIQFTTLEIKKIQQKAENIVFSGVIDSDMAPAIRCAFLENSKLNRRQIKYTLLNLNQFEAPLVNWLFQNHHVRALLVEKYLIYSWYSFSQLPTDYLELVSKYFGSPSFLLSWQDLADESRMRRLSEQKLPSFFSEETLPPIFVLRSYFFRLMVADFCFRFFDEESFLVLLGKLEKIRMNSLHLEEIIKSQSNDRAVKYMVATLLKYYRQGRPKSLVICNYLSALKPIFGDPRSVGQNWDEIRDITPEGFQNWVASLNEEDIIFFFDNLETVIHPERRAFWLKFVRRAHRINVILDEKSREKLKSRYSKDERLTQIINRSYQFNSHGGSIQQLIVLFFSGFVVVEGSNTGFGCQIYSAEVFNKKFGNSFNNINNYTINERSSSVFAGVNSGRMKMLRHRDSWEDSFLNFFSSLGIFPDSVPDRSGFSRTLEIVGSGSSLATREKKLDIAKSENIKKPLIPDKSINEFVDLIQRWGGEVIDKRPAGQVWIIYDLKYKTIIDEMRSSGYSIKLSQKGSKVSGNRMAWYIDE